MEKFTPKQSVLAADPDATLDFYELLRGMGKPCRFIRRGLQGAAYSGICASPRAAWKSAHNGLMEACGKQAA